MEFFTIGVFNSTEKTFFQKLTTNNIDLFCDIRQRRGVRGSKYSFVNSNRLQDKLKDMNIAYLYLRALAPTTEIRSLQKKQDLLMGESKTQRQELGQLFIDEYKNRVLKEFNFQTLKENLTSIGAERIVLFCVEEKAKACHRHLVAEKLIRQYNLNMIKDL